MANMVRGILSELKDRDEVLAILSDLFVSDDYVFTHSLNVTIYSLALGTELGLSEERLDQIGLGAILHDVGKMFIPQEVLQKNSKLTNYEFELIKEHTEKGFHFLRHAPSVPLAAAHCAYQHHERLDGSGYPRGLTEEDIHLNAKIIGIADVFDAVPSNRVYRDAMLPHEGLEILYAGTGKLFDKNMVEAFRKSIAVYPNGLSLELSDGRRGIVLRQSKNMCERPVLCILNEKGKPYELDLSTHLNIPVIHPE